MLQEPAHWCQIVATATRNASSQTRDTAVWLQLAATGYALLILLKCACFFHMSISPGLYIVFSGINIITKKVHCDIKSPVILLENKGHCRDPLHLSFQIHSLGYGVFSAMWSHRHNGITTNVPSEKHVPRYIVCCKRLAFDFTTCTETV